MADAGRGYPVNFQVDYPERSDRISTLFRLILVIPIAIILALVSGPTTQSGDDQGMRVVYASGGLVVAPVVLMLLFRQKYPRWWYDWNVALTKFATRVSAYVSLLRDEYPSTDEEQSVHLDIPYPDARTELNRWLPLVKWFLAIPHFIVLVFLHLAALFAIIIAWFAILITGQYPRGLFDYVVGVFRWSLRVTAYAFILTTDRYPPFRLRD